MKERLLAFAAIGEAITGLALLIVPSLVSWLLLGTQLTGVSIPIARVSGIALLGLGIACWPSCTALCGMLTYSALVTLYLTYVGIRGEWVGPLLWPAVALHAVLTLLLARAWFTHLYGQDCQEKRNTNRVRKDCVSEYDKIGTPAGTPRQ